MAYTVSTNQPALFLPDVVETLIDAAGNNVGASRDPAGPVVGINDPTSAGFTLATSAGTLTVTLSGMGFGYPGENEQMPPQQVDRLTGWVDTMTVSGTYVSPASDAPATFSDVTFSNFSFLSLDRLFELFTDDNPDFGIADFLQDTSWLVLGRNGDDDIIGSFRADDLFGFDGDDEILGLQGNDYMIGGAGMDSIAGGNGDDTAFGQADDDIIEGNDGDDYIEGNAGDDELSGGDGRDVVYGQQGSDFIAGGFDSDFLDGGVGDDFIDGGFETDTIVGGAGEDELEGSFGADEMFGGADNDLMDGGTDNDLMAGQGGDDDMIGGEDDDEMYGNAGDDQMAGDTVELGPNGNFVQFTGFGIDTMDGGAGADQLGGGNGNDILRGGADNDLLVGGEGTDNLFGGTGNDFMIGDNPFATVELFATGSAGFVPVPLEEVDMPGDVSQPVFNNSTSGSYNINVQGGELVDGNAIVRVDNTTSTDAPGLTVTSNLGFSTTFDLPAGTSVFINVGQPTSTSEVFTTTFPDSSSPTTTVDTGSTSGATDVTPFEPQYADNFIFIGTDIGFDEIEDFQLGEDLLVFSGLTAADVQNVSYTGGTGDGDVNISFGAAGSVFLSDVADHTNFDLEVDALFI